MSTGAPIAAPSAPPAPLFSEQLRRHASEHPSALALWFNGQAVDYRSLLADAESVARSLRSAGTVPGDRIAIIARPSLDYCRAIVGILLARCAAVPLATSLPGSALAALLGDAAPRAVFADTEGQAALEAAGHDGARIGIGDSSAAPDTLAAWLARRSASGPLAEQQADDLFSIIYSSGTTGIPKGIAHTTGVRSAFFALGASGSGNRTLLSTALFTNASFCTLAGTLYLGGACFIQERFDPPSFVALVEREAINQCFLVPVQIKRILALPDFHANRLRSLRTTVMSGSQCPIALKRELISAWPGNLIENYGLSEGGILTTLNITQSPDRLETVGTPLPGYEMRIVGEDDEPLPPGMEGEIVGRSPYVMQGYFNRDDLTRATIWQDPEGRMFQRTGDIGWVDQDGYLHISDRKKDVIISGGMNVYAAEIDQLLEQHPDVAEAAVVAGPSERWGETPVAFVALHPHATIGREALLDWVNARLAREMRVSAIEFANQLPRNAMGKVIKRELRDRYRAMRPAG